MVGLKSIKAFSSTESVIIFSLALLFLASIMYFSEENKGSYDNQRDFEKCKSLSLLIERVYEEDKFVKIKVKNSDSLNISKGWIKYNNVSCPLYVPTDDFSTSSSFYIISGSKVHFE